MGAPPDDDDADRDDRVGRLETVDASADSPAGVPGPGRPHAAASADPLVGRSLGRFIITARLGKGVMGVVYRARAFCGRRGPPPV